MSRENLFAYIVIVSCVAANFANVSFAAHDIGQDEWTPLSAGPITTWTAPLCGKGRLVVQPFFFYNRARGAFDAEGHYKAFKDKETKSQYQEQLFVQYGVTGRLEIAAQGVYQQNLHHKDGSSASTSGFGDSYLFARYCLIEEDGWLPHTSPLFQLKLPTGRYQKLDAAKLGTDFMGADTGGGSYDHGYGVNFTKKIKPFVLHADFVYNIPTETKVNGAKTRYANYANYDFGVEYFLPRGFNLMAECNGVVQGDKELDGAAVPASDFKSFVAVAGVGWSCEAIQTLLAYQRTLAGTNADVEDSVIFTFLHTF